MRCSCDAKIIGSSDGGDSGRKNAIENMVAPVEGYGGLWSEVSELYWRI